MKKRAQLMAHPFTAILTLVVIAFILFFGISVIRDVLKVNKEVDILALKNTLQKEVDAYYSLDEGSQKNIDIILPREIAYLCFVDQESNIDYSKIPNNKASLIAALTNRNIFPIPYENQPNIDPFSIDNLKPATNPLCIKTNSRLTARIRNEGSHVSISQ